MENFFDLIVLGAGSGGLAAAKRAASYGAKVAIVEADSIGGTCVIRGCVPKKLLVYGSMYKEYIANAKSFGVRINDFEINSDELLENVRLEVNRLSELHKSFLIDSGIEIFQGWGRFNSPNSIIINDSTHKNKPIEISAERILIAVGSMPSRPDISGANKAWVSDDIFKLKRLPENILIVGAGYIACEFACILAGLGVKVTQMIRGNHLLKNFDHQIVNILLENMNKKGIETIFNRSLLSIEGRPGELLAIDNSGFTMNFGGILFATGRKPFIDGLSLDRAGIFIDNNRIEVNEGNVTNISHIYAVGDVTNRVNLTPVAIDEGRKFADNIYGGKDQLVDYQNIPKAVFSQPEIASVGYSEKEAKHIYGDDKVNIKTSKFRPMSKALSKTGPLCLLKLVIENETGRILGCHMVGECAAEIIQMASISISMNATKSDFDRTMALHPTIAEEFVTMS